MNPNIWALLLAACLCAATPASGQSPRDESEEFFNSGNVVKLAIELGPKELDQLRRDPRKYVKATLKEGDKGGQSSGPKLGED